MSTSPFKQNIPWSSLGLLLFSYAVQGYLLHRFHRPLFAILLIGGYVLLQLITLTPVSQKIDITIRWVGLDVIQMMSILTAAFFAAAALVWVGILGILVLIVTVELLTRLDLHQAGLSPPQRFVILTVCLGLGLGLGWVSYVFVGHPPT